MLQFFRHLPALGESLAILVGAMPVAFLEPHLNAHNPLSVFNTKTPRERASECPALIGVVVMAVGVTIVCLPSSPQYARHGGRDVSRDASARQAAQRRQRRLGVWCSLQRYAAGPKDRIFQNWKLRFCVVWHKNKKINKGTFPVGHRGGPPHAVQLLVLLVGERSGKLSTGHRLLHHGDLWAPQHHPGKHSEDPQQQPGHRGRPLDEEDRRWHCQGWKIDEWKTALNRNKITQFFILGAPFYFSSAFILNYCLLFWHFTEKLLRQ